MKTQKGKKKLLLISASLLLAATLAACNDSTAGNIDDVTPSNGTQTNDPIVNTPDPGLDTDTDVDTDVDAPIDNEEDAAADLEVGGVEGSDDLGEAEPMEGTEDLESEASLDILPEDSEAEAELEASLDFVEEVPATN